MFNQFTKKTCELVLTDGVYLEKNLSFGERSTEVNIWLLRCFKEKYSFILSMFIHSV